MRPSSLSDKLQKKDVLNRQLHESKVALEESHNETAAALAGAEAAHLTGELTLTENERSASQRNENCNAIG